MLEVAYAAGMRSTVLFTACMQKVCMKSSRTCKTTSSTVGSNTHCVVSSGKSSMFGMIEPMIMTMQTPGLVRLLDLPLELLYSACSATNTGGFYAFFRALIDIEESTLDLCSCYTWILPMRENNEMFRIHLKVRGPWHIRVSVFVLPSETKCQLVKPPFAAAPLSSFQEHLTCQCGFDSVVVVKGVLSLCHSAVPMLGFARATPK